MTQCTRSMFLSGISLSFALSGLVYGQSGGADDQELSWQQAEEGVLADHIQLTFADQFVKAGESYFSPDNSRIIFQGVETPPDGEAADPFYGMYIADVMYDQRGLITGLEDIKRLSPKGSANTCGWFHPTDPNIVLFGSTIDAPSEKQPPGFERLSGRYRWMFPPDMQIVQCRLDEADGTAATLDIIYGDTESYQAESSLSPDGRHLLFCSLGSGLGDLFVKDLQTGAVTLLVGADGYDGGPFFSPDGKRICYRSDRRLNHYLQLFVADLEFDRNGSIVGIGQEYQLSDDDAVNWCPFWHPSGRFLLFATSREGHDNYEIYAVDADPGDLSGSTGPTRYGTRARRITHGPGADVLPAFNSDGSVMIWTAQRGADGGSQLWAARFVFDLDKSPIAQEPREDDVAAEMADEGDEDATINVRDPENGLIYMYDPLTHEVSVYDPTTHEVRSIMDDEEMERVQELFADR